MDYGSQDTVNLQEQERITFGSENVDDQSDEAESRAENELFRKLQEKVDKRLLEEAQTIAKQSKDASEVNYALDDGGELYQNQEGHPLIAEMMQQCD